MKKPLTEESVDSKASLPGETFEENSTETFKIFIFPPEVSGDLYPMMEKMVSALGYRSGEVSFLELSEEKLDKLKEEGSSKRILFFGDGYPGAFGQLVEWSGHSIMKTHGLDVLRDQPELKKETWEHLKKYGGFQ